jgi:biotin carboxyl carrier protein
VPEPEIAKAMLALDPADRVAVIRALPTERAALVFAELETVHQDEIVHVLAARETRALLEHLEPDDRTELLSELDEAETEELLSLLSVEDRREAARAVRDRAAPGGPGTRRADRERAERGEPVDMDFTRKRAGRLAVGLGLLSVAVAACQSGEANETAAGLQTATVERRSIVSSVEATGVVEPIRYIDVKSQASGEILELPVELGDYVEKGELLVRIDPRDVRNAYEQAEADLQVAEARFGVAERQLERTRTLRDSAVVTQDELESAILEHANARAALVKARTNLELARERVEDVTLRAPISGTIVERHNGIVVRDLETVMTEIGQVYVVVPVPDSVRTAGTAEN